MLVDFQFEHESEVIPLTILRKKDFPAISAWHMTYNAVSV